MNQAILITAYKNINHLSEIINHFDDNFSFYIHIDKKSTISENDLQSLKNQNKRVFISRDFVTNWGGVNHLKCSLLLMNEALKDKNIDYLHLISGHDFPLKSSAYFNTFLNENKGKQFLEFFSLPTKIWANGGLDRLQYYNLYDSINAKGKYGWLIHKLIAYQKKLGIKRNLNFENQQLHGGSTWWTLSKDCCSYISDFLKQNPLYLKRFNYTFCAEELFFQTVILNSPFKEQAVNDNLRHIVWEFKNGNVPANLDETDFSDLKKSAHLFARRFEYPVSEGVLKMLKENI